MAARKPAREAKVTTTTDLGATPVMDSGPTENATVTADAPYLDPVLEKARDEELKRIGSTELTVTRDEPYLDPALEAARDAAIKASQGK